MLVAGFKEYLKNRRFVQCFYKLQKQVIRFLNDLPCEQTEYEEDYVRTLMEKITVYDDNIIVEFKSGIEIHVNEYLVMQNHPQRFT